MSQHAWLELDGGMWRLVTHTRSKPTETSRKWADKKSALQELRDEGWTITGPYPRSLTQA
jgi:hypothetical protein